MWLASVSSLVYYRYAEESKYKGNDNGGPRC
jgi:hypothetical protein